MIEKAWGGRFSESTDPGVEMYTASIGFDKTLVYEDILGSLAHVAMLSKCSIVTVEEAEQIQQGLKDLANEMTQGKIQFSVSDEDIHMNMERLLCHKIGPVAKKLHTARSRNDQVALDMHLYVRRQIVCMVELLVGMQSVLIDLAKKHANTLVPGYTHMQRAQPMYLSQYWLAIMGMFDRDIQRFKDSLPRCNQSPLGAAALAGTTFPIDRQYVADLLQCDGVYVNTLDAVSDRDFVIEFVSNAAMVMMHVSRLSEDLVLWSSQEFGFISFSDAFSTGSSIMPQKKNPDVAELARGKTGRVYGALFSLLTLMKGLPMGYNKDFQEDKEPLFDVVTTLTNTLSIYQPMLTSMTIHQGAMEAATKHGYLNATALAEYFVKRGMAFRDAHASVGKLVSVALQKGVGLELLSLEEMQAWAPMTDENVYDALNMHQAVPTQDHCDAINLHEVTLRSHEAWIKVQRDRFQATALSPLFCMSEQCPE